MDLPVNVRTGREQFASVSRVVVVTHLTIGTIRPKLTPDGIGLKIEYFSSFPFKIKV